MQVSS